MSQSSQSQESAELHAAKYDPESQSSQHGGQDDNSLMRVVTEYTEYAVSHADSHNIEENNREVEEQENQEKQQDIEQMDKLGPIKTGFWSKRKTQERKSFLVQYAIIIVILWAFILSAFSIYWGSMYGRQNRFVNLKVLVAIEQGADVNNSDYPLSQAILETIQLPELETLLGWEPHNFTSDDEIVDKVYKQKYWAAIYVSSNDVSRQLVEAIENGSDLNTSSLVRCYYETGRDLNGQNQFVKPSLADFGVAFSQIVQQKVYPKLLSNLTPDQFAKLQNTSILTNTPTVEYIDGKKVTNTVVLAPLQVGLIYIIIITFFQVTWFQKLNQNVASHLKPKSYIGYRMVQSQVTFLLVSLGYSCLNAAFQIPMNKSWKGGFGVLWMFSYLAMAAVGGANENLSLICFAVFPPMMGFWLLFFVVSNISATFAPIEVCPEFYRFTYAFPIKNAYELMKMQLFDTYRGQLGRNIGVLIAWIVLNNILFPFCLYFFSWSMKRNMMKAKAGKN
ncbi:hypothetical protein OGAPHI_007156 [Ogataea philodendri]|uniref:DUF3533 domain-containing protein n=1 Tax=Ogataea philodendri TaxID=1378263 RepID=A0A9P8NVP4_9ASCO|nr:uncharacterized protein OGAPHI_007156 [Ogataea philodendri]KAH3660570.1 hypothetical protein OGAPHI_007156 [Ogataea philodendri]